jgi:glyoxylase-like metal-dependent hydrolase (beta-lactamase superfamily II)
MPFDRVRFFNAGDCSQFGYLAARVPRGLTRFKNVFVHLEHPVHGASMIDAGYSPHFFRATEPSPQRLYRWTTPVHLDEHEHAAAILASHGLHAENVGEIFISHFHGDHVAGLHHFPGARFVYRAEAYASLMRKSAWKQVRHGFLSALLPDDFVARGLPVASFDTTFAGFPACDFWGDGELLLVDLPGHSPGHTGFAFRTNGRQFFYIADACWDVDALLANRALPPPSRWMQHSYEMYVATQDRLRAFNAESGWTMLAAHCPRTQAFVEP